MPEEPNIITIIIVNWNSWELLDCCLDSLYVQTYKAFKVLIIDNASATPPPVDLFKIDLDIDFIQNNNNSGFAEANNRLIKMTENSEWIVLLNPDAFPEKDWLEQLIKTADQYPDFSFFSSRLLTTTMPRLIDGEGDCYHISGLAWRINHGNDVRNAKPQNREVFSACAAAAMYRTKAIHQIGGFDERFFCYFEDIDLGFRLRLMGHRCLFSGSAVVYHVGSATSGGQHSEFAIYHGHRNLVWTYMKNMPGILFWIFLPFHLLLNIATIYWFSMRKQGKTILCAKRDAIRQFPSVWRCRREIQNKRTVSTVEIIKAMNKSLIPHFTQMIRRRTTN